jgi:hypothetical protein
MKYPYTLYKNSSILLSDVAVPKFPEEIVFEGHKLFVKDEFHITLVSGKYLAKFVNPNDEEITLDQILQEFDKFTKTTKLEEYKISNDLRFVQIDKEKAIIVMADVTNLDRFFDHLSQKFSLELPRQQAHITLYRYPKDFIGIPIPSAEILQTTSRTVEVPELQKML